MVPFLKNAERGEWWEIGAELTSPLTGDPMDVTGRSVQAIVRDGPSEADDVVTVDGAMGSVLNGPGGLVAVGGRIAVVGTYYGTLVIGTSLDGPGWPVKERFRLYVADCP